MISSIAKRVASGESWYEFRYARFIRHKFSDDRLDLFVFFLFFWFTKMWQKHFFHHKLCRTVLPSDAIVIACKLCIYKMISLDK